MRAVESPFIPLNRTRQPERTYVKARVGEDRTDCRSDALAVLYSMSGSRAYAHMCEILRDASTRPPKMSFMVMFGFGSTLSPHAIADRAKEGLSFSVAWRLTVPGDILHERERVSGLS